MEQVNKHLKPYMSWVFMLFLSGFLIVPKLALAQSKIDIYVVYSGTSKKDKKGLKKVIPKSLRTKYYNADLLAVADYSGKQKAISKFNRAKIVIIVGDAPMHLLDGARLSKKLIIFNSKLMTISSDAPSYYLLDKSAGMYGLDRKTHEIVAPDAVAAIVADSKDGTLIVDTDKADIYQTALSLIMAINN